MDFVHVCDIYLSELGAFLALTYKLLTTTAGGDDELELDEDEVVDDGGGGDGEGSTCKLVAELAYTVATVGDVDKSNAEEELDGKLADLDVQGLSACDGRFKKYFFNVIMLFGSLETCTNVTCPIGQD